ncbi:hypothetical protein TCE0_033f09710 [Talaromyces pinophilus]|uniref:Uncharacterized protein n=1 Tax=Talaromyces pinophilus TaxID=128442 RepID=A0A6V8HBB7_TALPI|nr:hypothetical protein TCE0_033f09710 [Talaromyces pinophilus]
MEDYTESDAVTELYANIVRGGQHVPWTIPMGLWLNIVQRYLLLQNGWEVFLNGQYKLSTLYTTSIVNRHTLQPRFVIATLEESFFGMNEGDIPFLNMVRDATEYMLKERRRWIRIRGADGPAAWKTVYFPNHGYKRFCDAFNDFALIDSLLARIAEVVAE